MVFFLRIFVQDEGESDKIFFRVPSYVRILFFNEVYIVTLFKLNEFLWFDTRKRRLYFYVRV